MIINGRDLRHLPSHRFDGGAESAISNIAAQTAFGCLLTGIPAALSGDVLAIDTIVKLVVNPGDGCRLRLKAALVSADLVSAGVEILSLDIADSGLVHVRGHLYARSTGASVPTDVELDAKTGDGIPSATIPTISTVTLNLSAAWRLGWTLEDLPTWGASSTGTVRHNYGYLNNGRIP